MHKYNGFVYVLLACWLAVAGCKTTMLSPEGQTLATYSLGNLRAVEPKNISVVYAAAVKAVEALQLSVTQKTQDALSGKIIARDSRDKKVSITLAAVSESSTKVSIRAGALGDESKARLIYNQIRANLQ
jgi:hypothetical protein